MLIVLDRATLVDLIRLTLNHGAYLTRTACTAEAAAAVMDEWQPHLVLFDADLEGQRVMQHVGARAASGARLPAIALTRRGDLRTKLAAFDWGVDDILTIPFAPEERSTQEEVGSPSAGPSRSPDEPMAAMHRRRPRGRPVAGTVTAADLATLPPVGRSSLRMPG